MYCKNSTAIALQIVQAITGQFRCKDISISQNNFIFCKNNFIVGSKLHTNVAFEISNGELPAWVFTCPYHQLGGSLLPISENGACAQIL